MAEKIDDKVKLKWGNENLRELLDLIQSSLNEEESEGISESTENDREEESQSIVSEKINPYTKADSKKMHLNEKAGTNSNSKEDMIYAVLHEELNNLVTTAHKIHDICFAKICSCYGEKEVKLPIDIGMVAKKLDVKIEYENLNYADRRKIDQNIAQLHYELSGSTVVKKIIVDNNISKNKSGNLSNLEKYAVAYELGKIIVGNEENVTPEMVRKLNRESRPYSLPRLSARLENFEYEMCAIFLLLPMELFFKEFQSFLDQIEDHPVLMDKWIEHLSPKADIPKYQLINGYQYIKFSAYRYYEMHLSQKDVNGVDFRALYNV